MRAQIAALEARKARAPAAAAAASSLKLRARQSQAASHAAGALQPGRLSSSDAEVAAEPDAGDASPDSRRSSCWKTCKTSWAAPFFLSVLRSVTYCSWLDFLMHWLVADKVFLQVFRQDPEAAAEAGRHCCHHNPAAQATAAAAAAAVG